MSERMRLQLGLVLCVVAVSSAPAPSPPPAPPSILQRVIKIALSDEQETDLSVLLDEDNLLLLAGLVVAPYYLRLLHDYLLDRWSGCLSEAWKWVRRYGLGLRTTKRGVIGLSIVEVLQSRIPWEEVCVNPRPHSHPHHIGTSSRPTSRHVPRVSQASLPVLSHAQARLMAGSEPGWALAAGLARLLLWHNLQPIVFCAVFEACWPELSSLQRTLGLLVALREVIYVALTLVCVRVNPAFLLVDTAATWRKEPLIALTFTLVYVISPEKFVWLAVLCGIRSGA